MQLVSIDHQYLLPLQESSTSIFLLIHTKPNNSFLQRFAAGWTHGEANPQGSDTHSLQPPLLKQWTLGNLHFISFQGKFRGYSVVLSDVFSMSFFDTEIWARFFFFYLLFILFKLANSVGNCKDQTCICYRRCSVSCCLWSQTSNRIRTQAVNIFWAVAVASLGNLVWVPSWRRLSFSGTYNKQCSFVFKLAPLPGSPCLSLQLVHPAPPSLTF